MSSPSAPTGPLRKAWHVWKSLRLPWRKRFFVGQDPQGNTYYELRQPRGDPNPDGQAQQYRRLVYYPRSTPYDEVRVPPAWHQWLRHQRLSPPTMDEQLGELARQARVRLLAAEADARWEAKERLSDAPPPSSPVGTIRDGDRSDAAAAAVGGKTRPEEEWRGVEEGAAGRERRRGGEEDAARKKPRPGPDPEPDPWKRAQRGAPGESWQPAAWTPTPGKR